MNKKRKRKRIKLSDFVRRRKLCLLLFTFLRPVCVHANGYERTRDDCRIRIRQCVVDGKLFSFSVGSHSLFSLFTLVFFFSLNWITWLDPIYSTVEIRLNFPLQFYSSILFARCSLLISLFWRCQLWIFKHRQIGPATTNSHEILFWWSEKFAYSTKIVLLQYFMTVK